MSISTMSPNAFSSICDTLRTKSAIVLDSSKTYLVESRLAPVMIEHGLDSIDQLVSAMNQTGCSPLTQQVIEAMTTNETSFFRDLHPFEALKDTVFPELIRQRQKSKTLNLWSNACSSGQEVYSIAMLMREHFPELLDWNLRLFATDLSTQILDQAREGKFNQTEIKRGLPSRLLFKYFNQKGTHWQINDDIRKMVEFRVVNLAEPFPALPVFDMVFLRNVLIYFSTDTKQDILNRVRTMLCPDGYLFLGGAESTMNMDVRFERQQVGETFCYRPH